jgi:hypothetical protein
MGDVQDVRLSVPIQLLFIVHLRLCEVSIPPMNTYNLELSSLSLLEVHPCKLWCYLLSSGSRCQVLAQFLPVRQFEPGTERNWTGKNGSYLFGPVQFLVLAGGRQFSSQFSQRGKEPD